MMQRMPEYDVLRCTVEQNEYMERVKTWKSVGKIRAALSVATGSKQELNQALRVNSTHRAVTPGSVEVWDRLQAPDGATYAVDYIIPGTPYNQLFLTREDSASDQSQD